MGTLQSPNNPPVAVDGLPKMSPAPVQVATVQQPRINTLEFVSGAGGAGMASSSSSSSVGSPVIGVIDGKFESGYLVTVTIGKKKLKGVMYQAPTPTPPPINQVPQTGNKTDSKPTPTTSCLQKRRRRRRRKSEIRKRDPSHPKPNRSGYNFFFAEQHPRLKQLHPSKDRDISRMIGELWNNLKDNDKAVYQDKAIKDKERYRMEMEDYRERLRENQVISDAVPIQQRFPDLDVDMVEVDVKDGSASARDSLQLQTPEDDYSKSETEEDEDDDDNFSDTDTSPAVGVEYSEAQGDEKTSQGSDPQLVNTNPSTIT